MKLAALTQIQAAALLSVAPRTLRDWHDAPRNADGSYPGPALVAYYTAKLSGTTDFDSQRERLAAAQAERVEMENALRRGQLADIPTVARFWSECVANCRAKLLGLGAKLGPRLVNLADAAVIAAAIRAEVCAALTELAEFEPDVEPEPATRMARGAPAVSAAAGPDGESVGGSVPKAQ